MKDLFTIFPLGDAALTIDFSNIINEDINQKVLQLFHRLKDHSPFIKEVVPAYSSLTVYYDVPSLYTEQDTAIGTMRRMLLPILQNEEVVTAPRIRIVRMPVCYANAFALAIEEVAAQNNLSKAE